MITASQIKQLKSFDLNNIFDEIIKLSNLNLKYLNYNSLSDEYIVTKNKIEVLECEFPGFQNLLETYLKTM